MRRATKDQPADVGGMNLSWVPDCAIDLRQQKSP